MPLYEMTPDSFRPLSQASFADLKVRERDDLQRWLRTQIDVLGDDRLVPEGFVGEELQYLLAAGVGLCFDGPP